MENKFTEIELLGKHSTIGVLDGLVEITEKIDGSNFSFYRENEGDPLIFRSRRIELDEDGIIENRFGPAVDAVMAADAEFPFPAGKIFFGERMSKHTINYGKIEPFIGFAVKDIEYDTYESTWAGYFKDRDLPVVPALYFVSPSLEFIRSIVNSKSSFGDTEAIQEGIVLKNYDKQVFAKLVNEPFVEDSGRGKGYCVRKTNEDKVVKQFCTTARVKKGIFRVLDEHPELELDLAIMKYVPKEVSEDILKEEILAISKTCNQFDFKNFRKGCASVCKTVIIDMITEQAVA